MATVSRFASLYKVFYTHVTQEHRRKQILEKQKEQRSLAQDNGRELEDYVHVIRGEVRSRRHAKKQSEEHKLQLSEWLKSRPDDLEQWFLVPCPKGQRCLVIATEGRTEVYNKRGCYMYSFHSYIPGSATEQSHITALDCVYIEKASTFYVLDVMAYSNIDMLLCEAQFRFFWITSKFLEKPELSEISEGNKKRFLPLKFYDFEDEESINSCLLRYPQFDEDYLDLDGFLFYHKESGYVQGQTPLVGWLFAFMVPEILCLDVHPEYIKEKPSDYVDGLSYMTKFDKSLIEQKKQRKRRGRGEVRKVRAEVSEEDMVVDLVEAEQQLEMYGKRFDDPYDDGVDQHT